MDMLSTSDWYWLTYLALLLETGLNTPYSSLSARIKFCLYQEIFIWQFEAFALSKSLISRKKRFCWWEM